MRERGLKLVMLAATAPGCCVAPHAGAWIETNGFAPINFSSVVAPHAGAWIETCSWLGEIYRNIVAPHAGAWIETP